jgi:hypothetical protein
LPVIKALLTKCLDRGQIDYLLFALGPRVYVNAFDLLLKQADHRQFEANCLSGASRCYKIVRVVNFKKEIARAYRQLRNSRQTRTKRSSTLNNWSTTAKALLIDKNIPD